jgi:hypothetical protein
MGVIKCVITMLTRAPRAASAKRDHAIARSRELGYLGASAARQRRDVAPGLLPTGASLPSEPSLGRADSATAKSDRRSISSE